MFNYEVHHKHGQQSVIIYTGEHRQERATAYYLTDKFSSYYRYHDKEQLPYIEILLTSAMNGDETARKFFDRWQEAEPTLKESVRIQEALKIWNGES